ncbi:MAG: PleD family two-component system response regulator [Candidatus Competibacterales bacterium]
MARILIIDDSPTETFAFKRMLEESGYHTLNATNAEDGVALAKREKPDLILMDVVMPGMNGFQATRLLSRDPDTANIPVIMVTTKDQETDRIWGLRQGARDYVVKPPSTKEFIAKIRALLDAGANSDAG